MRKLALSQKGGFGKESYGEEFLLHMRKHGYEEN